MSIILDGSTGITLPTGAEVVSTTGTQTLTNKSISADQVNSGTMATARLGSGTADSTTFLRGDNTWAAPAGGVTSLNGQTGAITNTGVDAIGSYVVAVRAVTATSTRSRTAVGSTIAGSTLRRGYSVSSIPQSDLGGAYTAGGTSYSGGGTAMSGTWRCMGSDNVVYYEGSSYWVSGLWVRIS